MLFQKSIVAFPSFRDKIILSSLPQPVAYPVPKSFMFRALDVRIRFRMIEQRNLVAAYAQQQQRSYEIERQRQQQERALSMYIEQERQKQQQQRAAMEQSMIQQMLQKAAYEQLHQQHAAAAVAARTPAPPGAMLPTTSHMTPPLRQDSKPAVGQAPLRTKAAMKEMPPMSLTYDFARNVQPLAQSSSHPGFNPAGFIESIITSHVTSSSTPSAPSMQSAPSIQRSHGHQISGQLAPGVSAAHLRPSPAHGQGQPQHGVNLLNRINDIISQDYERAAQHQAQSGSMSYDLEPVSSPETEDKSPCRKAG